MKVTEVRIKKVTAVDSGKVLAYASVTLDGEMVIHNIRVIDGKGGAFIAMPCRKLGSGEYKDVVHPIDTEFRTYLQDQILQAYANATDGEAGQNA